MLIALSAASTLDGERIQKSANAIQGEQTPAKTEDEKGTAKPKDTKAEQAPSPLEVANQSTKLAKLGMIGMPTMISETIPSAGRCIAGIIRLTEEIMGNPEKTLDDMFEKGDSSEEWNGIKATNKKHGTKLEQKERQCTYSCQEEVRKSLYSDAYKKRRLLWQLLPQLAADVDKIPDARNAMEFETISLRKRLADEGIEVCNQEVHDRFIEVDEALQAILVEVESHHIDSKGHYSRSQDQVFLRWKTELRRPYIDGLVVDGIEEREGEGSLKSKIDKIMGTNRAQGIVALAQLAKTYFLGVSGTYAACAVLEQTNDLIKAVRNEWWAFGRKCSAAGKALDQLIPRRSSSQ